MWSTRWRNSFFVNCQVHLLIEQEFSMQSNLCTYPTCLLQYCTMAGYRAHLRSLEKLACAYGWCIFGSVFTFCLAFHTVALELPLILVFYVNILQFCFSLRLMDILVLFVLAVPQYFTAWVHKPQGNPGDEKLSMYILCSTFSIHAVNLVTVAWVAVIQGVPCSPS